MAELISGGLGKLQGTAQGLLNQGTSLLDKIIPPEKRAELWSKLQSFLAERPGLATFLASQICVSGPIFALFIAMTITIVLFSLIAGLLIGLLGAVLFIVGAILFALLFVLPVLFFTTLIATFIWLWGFGTYWLIKNYNQKSIPGIHTDLKSGLGFRGTGAGTAPARDDKVDGAGHGEKRPPKLESRGHENGRGKKDGLPVKQITDSVGDATGVDVGGHVNGVTKKVGAGDLYHATNGVKEHVGGITKNLPVAGGLTG